MNEFFSFLNRLIYEPLFEIDVLFLFTFMYLLDVGCTKDEGSKLYSTRQISSEFRSNRVIELKLTARCKRKWYVC